MISTLQPQRSAKRPYIRKSSAANSVASFPPVPARISSRTFFSSFGSFGISSTWSSFWQLSARPCEHGQLLFGELTHFRVGLALEQPLGLLDRAEDFLVLPKLVDDAAQLGMGLGMFLVRRGIGQDARVREEPIQLFEFLFKRVQFVNHTIGPAGVGWRGLRRSGCGKTR